MKTKLKTINRLIMYKALTKSPDSGKASIATSLYKVTMEAKKITETEVENESTKEDLFHIEASNEFSLNFIEYFLEQLNINHQTFKNKKKTLKHKIYFKTTKAQGCYILTQLDYKIEKLNEALNKTLDKYKSKNLPFPEIKSKGEWIVIDLSRDIK